MTTSEDPPLVLLGKYRVLRRIGAGGMGVVLAAENLRTGGQFAIKVLRRSTVPDEMVRRFMVEARAAVRVRHPNVVQVFDLEDDPEHGSLYIVQELLEGETLGARLRREGALTPAQAMEVAAPLMDALALAHGMGVVHRDLKPENLFLTRGTGGACVPKVIDFGIAKLLDRDGSLVTEGMLGTPAYMAPEQIEDARSVDARTDVWSMGVVLYEMLSGRCPFRRDTPLETITAVLCEPVPGVGAVAPGVPTPMADAVDRAMLRDRALRHATIEAFLAALRGQETATSVVHAPTLRQGSSPPPPPRDPLGPVAHTPRDPTSPRSSRPMLVALLAGAGVLATLVLAQLAASTMGRPRAPVQTQAALTPVPSPSPAPSPMAADDTHVPEADAVVDAPASPPRPAAPALQRHARNVAHDASTRGDAPPTPAEVPASEEPLANGAISPR